MGNIINECMAGVKVNVHNAFQSGWNISTVFDMEKIYVCLLVISNKRNLSLELVNLLWIVHNANLHLFQEYCHMRSSNKSAPATKLAVVSVMEVPDVEIMDANSTPIPCQMTTVSHCEHNKTRDDQAAVQ